MPTRQKLCLSVVVLALAYIVVGCAYNKSETKTSTSTKTETAVPKEVSSVTEKTVLRFDFPSDYKNWTHGVSKIILDKSSPLYGFQQVFVNDTALSAYKNGGGYPDGSMLIIGFYEPIKDGDTITQGDIIWYASMKKDSSATKTGGWIMDGFDGKTLKSKIDNPTTGCFICHMAQKDNDYVFSKYVP